MFRSSFAKYITAFVAIIIASFLALSGIITSLIRTYVSANKETELAATAERLVNQIEADNTENIGNYIYSEKLTPAIKQVVNSDLAVDVLVTDESGKILLSTVTDGASSGGIKEPVINLRDGLGTVSLALFEDEGDTHNAQGIHRGNLDGVLHEPSVAFLCDVRYNDDVKGYVVTVASTVIEDNLVSITRQAVITSSILVMIAAVVATYLITQRIISPLRAMTGAASKFAKGDFSSRVKVVGKDEVADLAVAFNNMADSLDSLEKMRNSFLANISHDLRTPMTTISGFIDGITSGAIPPEKHEYYLNVISAEVHRLSRLVSQILDVSRIESGERKFTFVDFDIAEMARIILISFEQKIEDKKLDVEFNAEFDEMYVRADKDAIYQVLYNLCHNAIKFSREGGKFIISISYMQSKRIRVSVFDEGASIANEDIKLVFDRFYKTDKSRGLDKNGVGLGLYISKTIIDAHEEEIWAESIEGESSEFIFTLKEGTAPVRRIPGENDHPFA